ncbi:FkbM family methyltransferase [Ruegeria lacuscaerulensis]|uniref:FkbM family methyltransferase n=1 Tax=Ruegeria lacuscaerulensis TaxID=55218 RepID=UPI00147E6099|nr:FkbM family methyltransferase [Ruegeria lacuscaerulensis]
MTYGDQKGQVDFLVNYVFDYENKGLPKNGFFVDLACADGVYINNTYFLEKWLGWDGLLFEPNPGFWPNINNERRARLIKKAVTDQAGQILPFRIDNGMLGGIVAEDMDNNSTVRSEELKEAEIVNVETTTLTDELNACDAPLVIDFLSLDIEGAELLAVKGLDLEKYNIRCATIERPTQELDILLDAHGYRQARHLMYDVIHVHEDYWNEINWKPNGIFSFTPKIDW